MNDRNFKMLGKFSIPVPAVSSPTQIPWRRGKNKKKQKRERERKDISSTEPVVSSGLSYNNHYVYERKLASG